MMKMCIRDSFYINSPGGSVSAGLSIYDTMQFIKPDVSTLCMGQACSMAVSYTHLDVYKRQVYTSGQQYQVTNLTDPDGLVLQKTLLWVLGLDFTQFTDCLLYTSRCV